jgi:hypothetical protein
MTTLRTAAQQALAAMDYMLNNGEWYQAQERAEALRAALAEREEDRADELTVAYMMGAHSKLRTLTDEVIADLWYQNGTHHHFARAIERYLKGEK